MNLIEDIALLFSELIIGIIKLMWWMIKIIVPLALVGGVIALVVAFPLSVIAFVLVVGLFR